MSWVDELKSFFGLRGGPRRKRVAVLGVDGSGKTSLILSICQYLSRNGFGGPTPESLPYFSEQIQHEVAHGTVPTMSWNAFAVELRRLPSDRGIVDVSLEIASSDLPGHEFKQLVAEVANLASTNTRAARDNPVFQRFKKLLEGCDGVMFVVDVVRGHDSSAFATPDQALATVRLSLTEQLSPIGTAITVAHQHNVTLARKPFLFVFTKPDIHKIPADRMDSLFDGAMAMPKAVLEREQAVVRRYDVQGAGWELEDRLEKLGLGPLLLDIAYATDSVIPPEAR